MELMMNYEKCYNVNTWITEYMACREVHIMSIKLISYFYTTYTPLCLKTLSIEMRTLRNKKVLM